VTVDQQAQALSIDPAVVRTEADFAAGLKRIQQQSGLTLPGIERAAGTLPRQTGRSASLPKSTVSEVLRAIRFPSKEFMINFLLVLDISEKDRTAWMTVWERLRVDGSKPPPGALRVDEVPPRQLGIHASITTPDTTGDLPTYVPRDCDRLVRDVVANPTGGGCFVVLVGRSSVGKTRCLYETVRQVVPNWWLIQPADVADVVDLAEAPPANIVVWLDELQRFLDGEKPLSEATVHALTRAGAMVVGTLWPEEHASISLFDAVRSHDGRAQTRRLLQSAHIIDVPEALTEDELALAASLASGDGRLRSALNVTDAGLTQTLAAGPQVVRWWQQTSNPYANAAITAALDARRLGVLSPLSRPLLTEAMVDYLQPRHRVLDQQRWVDEAEPDATRSVLGVVSALRVTAGATPGVPAGFVPADYLVQHASALRRSVCPPASAWKALIKHVEDPADLHRLVGSAIRRMRYQYVVPVLQHLSATGDREAVLEFADILVSRGRMEWAIALLRPYVTGDSADEPMARRHADLIAVDARIKQLQERSAGDAPSRKVAEILADRGNTEALRLRAAAGDSTAQDELASILAERGHIEELTARADAGNRFAAERLAQLLAKRDIRLLVARANRSDEAAAYQLAKLLARRGDMEQLATRAATGDKFSTHQLALLERRGQPPQADEPFDEQQADSIGSTPIEERIKTLRRKADSGDRPAAEELTRLLLEHRREKDLRHEVDAGTYLSGDRLCSLLISQGAAHEAAIHLRTFGLNADGTPAAHASQETNDGTEEFSPVKQHDEGGDRAC
jgi:hypothetical protein